jgi:hypothetical protein
MKRSAKGDEVSSKKSKFEGAAASAEFLKRLQDQRLEAGEDILEFKINKKRVKILNDVSRDANSSARNCNLLLLGSISRRKYERNRILDGQGPAS